MTRRFSIVSCTLWCICLAAQLPDAFGQGTAADYARANGLREARAGSVYKTRVEPHWLSDGDRFWYRNSLADKKNEFILVEANKGLRRPAFDHAKVAAALTKALGYSVDAERLPITSLDYPPRSNRLETADVTAIGKTGWRPPERFAAKARDGRTDIYGIIHKPSNFDPLKRYPVIENIYAGPHGSHVPKAFAAHHSSQEMAELGFIVVQIDGMGTSNRSKAFHDVCWKNLADAGLPDRILWMKAAAVARPYMDLSRVGIYGGSAGGQSALGALLDHGDFYKAAVADCGCHDNRMDKVWWNELWMGWPVGPEYAEQSNVTRAAKLKGKLLLIVGEMDTNVDPASTMQVVNALINADKDFELLVVPGGGHGIGESPYGRRRRQDFFVRNLLGVEPRANRP